MSEKEPFLPRFTDSVFYRYRFAIETMFEFFDDVRANPKILFEPLHFHFKEWQYKLAIVLELLIIAMIIQSIWSQFYKGEFSWWSTFIAVFNICNFLMFMSGLLYRTSITHKWPVWWLATHGFSVTNSSMEKGTDGIWSNHVVGEMVDWCGENIKDTEWTLSDPSNALELAQSFGVVVRTNLNLSQPMMFWFRKREDAMIFKLTFGGDYGK